MELGNMRGVCMRYNDIKHDRMIFDDRAPAFQISHGEVNANGAGDALFLVSAWLQARGDMQ